MSLFEELNQSFPVEVVEPYGEVLIVPSKAFKSEWKERLQSEGVKIYVQNYGSQSCFFLRKTGQNKASAEVKAENEVNTQAPLKKRVRKVWSETEIAELQSLRAKGLTHKEIARHFGRSVHGVGHKLRELESINAEPKVSETTIAEPEPKSESESESDSDMVKEFLSAVNVLYPSYKKACAFLLKEASNKLLET